MSTLKISDIPTLARWTEVGVTENDNALNGFINTLQERISALVVIEDNYTPLRPGEEPSEEYKTINSCCRTMALLLADLKSIRREVHTARLLNADGQKPEKGGAA